VPVVCPLSGGLDPRLLACLLVERGLEVETLTVDPEWGPCGPLDPGSNRT
jgi:tRNA U34 2-thiouridine synthase MnmA/TrmU